MLYTFELTEERLDRVTDYLAIVYTAGAQQYIVYVQQRLTDDLLYVVVDCSPESATFIHLIA